MSAGKPYWVGDGGEPELFVPGQSGSIIPASRMGGGNGGLVYSPVYNIDARGGDSELARRLPAILANHGRKTKADIVTFLNKGYMPA